MQLQEPRAPVATVNYCLEQVKSGVEDPGGGRAAQEQSRYLCREAVMVYGPFLDSPTGALECCNCCNELWAVYGRIIRSPVLFLGLFYC